MGIFYSFVNPRRPAIDLRIDRTTRIVAVFVGLTAARHPSGADIVTSCYRPDRILTFVYEAVSSRNYWAVSSRVWPSSRSLQVLGDVFREVGQNQVRTRSFDRQ